MPPQPQPEEDLRHKAEDREGGSPGGSRRPPQRTDTTRKMTKTNEDDYRDNEEDDEDKEEDEEEKEDDGEDEQ